MKFFFLIRDDIQRIGCARSPKLLDFSVHEWGKPLLILITRGKQKHFVIPFYVKDNQFNCIGMCEI